MSAMRVVWGAICGAVCLGIACAPSQAQFVGENLLVTVPAGFKLGYEGSRPGLNLQEWVPENETVENWSEMVTTQVFQQRTDIDPARMLQGIGKQWREACSGSTSTPITNGQVNGYPASMVLMRCPRLPATGKPETTMFRAIKGNDSFYMVQSAVRSVPDEAQLERMKQYLDKVSVCDSRLPARPCPNLGGPK